MKKKLLIITLTVARLFGLFAIARALTAGQLRILCYHGAAIKDENEFRPGLFMTRDTFERRMGFLSHANYPVLQLGDALEKLWNGRLPNGGTVITIDDGWLGTYLNQYPVLRKHNFPATLYIASYYLEHQTQVFNVALSYVFWKSESVSLSSRVLEELIGQTSGGQQSLVSIEEVCTRINEFAETLDSSADRQLLLRDVCSVVGLDIDLLENSRQISFMNAEEAKEIGANGIDIQLHTHRHRFPDTEFEVAKTEILDNRRALEGLGVSALRHFCYPSGIYSAKSIDYLRELDIDSATTTNPGFNHKTASSFELKRFLDSEKISDIEFQAEMSGFLELIRLTGFRI